MSRQSELEAEIATLREELRNKEAELAAETARSMLLTKIHHDLRTQLTMILGPLDEMLSVGSLPSPMRRGLRRVQRNATRMHRIIEHLMLFARATGGKLTAQPEPVDVAQLVTDIVEDAQPLAKAHGLSLSLLASHVPAAVELDPQLFERISVNLLSNALAFTGDGGTIEVALDYGGGELQLAVRDTGAGISADELARIFEPYVQGSAPRRNAGTGLGLTVVRELTQLMGGRIEVQSEVGEGSTFKAILPAPARDSTALPPRLAIERSRFLDAGASDAAIRLPDFPGSADRFQRLDRATTRPNGPKPRLLAVDDSEDMRAYLAELLADEFEVITVASGDAAWEALQTQAFEVVVADVMMPTMHGFELIETIKSNPLLASIPIILVTARGANEAALGLDIGADDYLAKPFVPVELRARVRAARRMAEVQQQLRDQSHMAGMATMANDIMHDIGGVIGKLVESATLIENHLMASWAPASLERLVKKLSEQEPRNLDETSEQHYLPVYLNSLAKQLAGEQRIVAGELRALKANVEYIESVLHAHEELARSAGITELVVPSDLVEDAIALSAEGLVNEGITVEHREEDMPPIGLERHRVLQILVNLLTHAQHGLASVEQPDKSIRVHTRCIDDERLAISITDNGPGMTPEALRYVFEAGYAKGHGTGLHTSAAAASELGGRLLCHSDGPGHGTTFILEVPYIPIGG